MWIGGDAIMFGLMMLVYLLWSTDERAASSGHGWLERARSTSFAHLVAAHQPDQALGAAGGQAAADPAAGSAGRAAAATPDWNRPGGIDDDEHLAAYNAFLARLNQAESGRNK
jgi:hypothetical protein